MTPVIFHLAFPVRNIPDTKAFYADGLGCTVGRESPDSVILGLYGHQLVAHVAEPASAPQIGIYPRHFGLVFAVEAEWEALWQRVQAQKLTIHQGAKRRFPGLPLEHRTFFLKDPFDNFLEFKFYCHSEAIFGSRDFNQVGDRS